jgi:hypothetical protein
MKFGSLCEMDPRASRIVPACIADRDRRASGASGRTSASRSLLRADVLESNASDGGISLGAKRAHELIANAPGGEIAPIRFDLRATASHRIGDSRPGRRDELSGCAAARVWA